MMNLFLKSIANRFGYEVQRKSKRQVDLERRSKLAIQKVMPYTMLPKSRLWALYDQVNYLDLNNIEGALVECGVWKGGAIALMALAHQHEGGRFRNLHLFDSFQDICQPDSGIDGPLAASQASSVNSVSHGYLVPMKNFYQKVGGHGTLEGNKRLLINEVNYDPSLVYFHEGWFQDTLPLDAASIGKIALLRLDGDWYASTKVCLEYLFDKVVPGGIVIVDDYGTYEGCQKAVDEFLFERGITAYIQHIDAGCIYFIKNNC